MTMMLGDDLSEAREILPATGDKLGPDFDRLSALGLGNA